MPPAEVGFKLTFDAKQEGGHYLKVKYTWFKLDAPADGSAQPTVSKEEHDTGNMKDWQLVQIEGEEAVEEVVDDPKAKKGGAPAKGGKGGLEEITDNRPREIKYVKDWAGDDIKMRISESVAQYIEKTCLQV